MLVAATTCETLHLRNICTLTFLQCWLPPLVVRPYISRALDTTTTIKGENGRQACECIEHDLSDLQPKAGHCGMLDVALAMPCIT